MASKEEITKEIDDEIDRLKQAKKEISKDEHNPNAPGAIAGIPF